MALDYLMIPHEYDVLYFDVYLLRLKLCSSATSVSIERIFSQWHILLNHIRNWLLAQTTRALLCLGDWSKMSLVKNEDIFAVTGEPEQEGVESVEELENGWDSVKPAW